MSTNPNRDGAAPASAAAHDIPVEDLLDGIGSLLKDTVVAEVSKNWNALFADRAGRRALAGPAGEVIRELSDHQRQILHMAVAGYHKKDIARELHISAETLEAHCLAIVGELEEKLSRP